MTRFPNIVSSYRKQLSSQEPLSVGGITSAYRQKHSRAGKQPKISGVFQPTILSAKTQQQLETYPRSEQFKPMPQGSQIQNGDTGNHQDLPPARGVSYLNRFQGCLLPHSNTGTIQEISEISHPGSDIPVKALPFGLSTAPMEFNVVVKEVKLMTIHKGIRIHQYLDNWLVRARSHQACLQHAQVLVKMYQKLGWLVNFKKSELEPKQVFDFVGYQFDLRSDRYWIGGRVFKKKILKLLSLPACPVRQFMSLIGLLTATEKQGHLGRLHMRPIKWHLKNNWRVLESLEKVIPIPMSLHSHLQWWLKEDNVFTGQPLHPIKHALKILVRWGAHLDKHTARETWSLPESKLHINYLELKAVFLALKEFQDLWSDKIVPVATNNTTVVLYINKEGGMRLGPLCALLWRILTWCTRKQVTLKARHIPSWLNVVADKLSRLGQTIQMEWSLLPEVFQTICSRWHRPQIDLFATRFSNKLPLFVSPVPIPWPQQWMHSACHGRIWTHMPSHQQPYWAKWCSCRTPHARESF